MLMGFADTKTHVALFISQSYLIVAHFSLPCFIFFTDNQLMK
jgi:hypothetical protein